MLVGSQVGDDPRSEEYRVLVMAQLQCPVEVETELKNSRAPKCGIKEEKEERLGDGKLSCGLILRVGDCPFRSIASSLLGERPILPSKV